MNRAEVIVVGAGTTGCLVARDLARQGRQVLVVERGARESLGHDWWDTVERAVFDEVALAAPRPPEKVARYSFTICYADGRETVTAHMPDTMVNVDRKLFAARLVGEAEAAGATFRFGLGVAEPIREAGRVLGVRAVDHDGRRHELRAPITVDASGVDSALRRQMPAVWGFDPTLPRGTTLVTYREIRADRSAGRGRSVLYLGVEGGAQWVSRAESGLVDVFAGVLDREGHKDPATLTARLVAQEGQMSEDLSRGGAWARIPLRRAWDSLVAPGLLLVGDSACMASPLNGSGISSGLRAAHLLARTVDEALGRGRADVAALWSYNHGYQTGQGRLFARLHMLQSHMLQEDPDLAALSFERGVFAPEDCWAIEHALSPAVMLSRLPQSLTMLDRPRFVARLGRTMALVGLLDLHYRNYPKVYDPTRFARWRRTSELLFAALPSV